MEQRIRDLLAKIQGKNYEQIKKIVKEASPYVKDEMLRKVKTKEDYEILKTSPKYEEIRDRTISAEMYQFLDSLSYSGYTDDAFVERQLSKKDFIWCNTYRYDFYIPKYNIIIETHGAQHYNYSKGWNSGKSQEIIDKKKKTLALKNNITDYIELDCRKSDKEYIKDSILNSELINYFDFNKINWDKADEYATNNLIKEVCEYYELHKNDILMKDIAKKFNITMPTLKKYIKKGEKLGWCKYIKRYNSISYKRKFKKVKVIEDNKIFNNVNECINYYKKIGINFTLNSIRKNCRGETKTYKGFHFEYIDEE